LPFSDSAALLAVGPAVLQRDGATVREHQLALSLYVI